MRAGQSQTRMGTTSAPAFFGALMLSVAVVLLAGEGTALAARGLVTGFADSLYQSSSPAERSLWLDRTMDAGAGLVRLNVRWSATAPAQPPDPTNPGSAGYNFATADAAVRDARSRGLTVLLTVSGAPSWAEGPSRPASADPGTWEPNASAFAAFMQAVAARYSGGFDPDGAAPAAPLPAVQAVQIWNEPNLPEYLNPQYRGDAAVSPTTYLSLLNASYSAVKAVAPDMLVVTGGTSPYGDAPGGKRVRPVAFYRQLLCLQSKRKKGKRRKRRSRLVRADHCDGRPSFDVLAHHPINTTGAPTRAAVNADDAASADLGRITRVLRAAEKVGTAPPGRHPVWATEMWWDSRPPNAVGSPLGRQARWVEQALYLLWRDGASTVINLVIRDVPGAPTNRLNGGQSGLYFAHGRPKPSLTAFSFPFVADRIDKRRIRAWGKAPAAGRLVIQRRRGKRWVPVTKLRVRRGAVFVASLPLRGKRRLRAVVGGTRSLVWTER